MIKFGTTESHHHTHKMNKKILLGLGILFLLVASVWALEVIYNPYTGKFDYVTGIANVDKTGFNYTADWYFGNMQSTNVSVVDAGAY